VLAHMGLNFFVSGHSPRRMGNAHPNLVPYQVFEAADGPIVIATGNSRQSRDLCRILGLDELAADPRYAANEDRVRNRDSFIAALSQAILGRERAGLLAALEAANVPAGPIYTIGEAFADPQVVARRMRLDLPATGARGGTVPAVRTPILMDGEPFVTATAAPRLGEHTDEVLGQLGLGAPDIAALRAKGAVG